MKQTASSSVLLRPSLRRRDQWPEADKTEFLETAASEATLEAAEIWTPQGGPGAPQYEAYNCTADVIGYGGAAGGGKTDMLIGLAANKHRRSIIFRRVFPNARGIIERSKEIFTDPAFRFNETTHLWRLGPARTLEIGAMQLEDNKKAHQGQARDFIGFDEATEFTESQVRFVMGWNRSTIPGQRSQAVLTFNPPTDEAGTWITRFFAPWLDKEHHNPAKDGEFRWFAMIDGEEKETGSEPFEHAGEMIQPKSRTFFHATLKDNPILASTGYAATIDAMPEPLRSLLRGNFDAARISDPWQVIPGEWVRAANRRWRERGKPDVLCSCLGVDVSRGGSAKTVIAKRYGNYVAPLKKFPGKSTPDGPSVAAVVTSEYEGSAVIQIDAIGVGTSPYDILKANGFKVTPVVASEKSNQTDRSRKLKFRNIRAEMWWAMREALDPTNGDDLCLPEDQELLADLCAPKWELSTAGILIESKDDIFERIGRSTDSGDAVVMACWIDKRGVFTQGEWYR